MVVYAQNLASEGSLINASGVGLPKALLEILQQASMAKLDRVLRLMLDHQVRVAMQRWRYTSMQHTETEKLGAIKRDAEMEHVELKRAHEEELARARRAWKKDRDDHMREHGVELDDEVRMPTEEVHRMTINDKKHREHLNQLQVAHIKKKDDVRLLAERKAMDCERKMNSMRLAGLMPLAKPSRPVAGRTWEVDDFDTESLQWAFTTAPESCLIPFKQAVEMKEQQHDLAKRLQLILEYADKLPQWSQRASANRGKISKKVPQIGPDWRATWMKSVLRRVQAACALKSAFVKLAQVPRGTFKTRRKSINESQFAQQAWEHQEQLHAQSQAPVNSRKSVFIKHGNDHRLKPPLKHHRRSSEEFNSEDDQDESRRQSLNSMNTFVEVVRAAERRSDVLVEQPGAPFHLGDDYGYRFDFPQAARRSSSGNIAQAAARRSSSGNIRSGMTESPSYPSRHRPSFSLEQGGDGENVGHNREQNESPRRGSTTSKSFPRSSVKSFSHPDGDREMVSPREEAPARHHSLSMGTEYRQADTVQLPEKPEETGLIVEHRGAASATSSSPDES